MLQKKIKEIEILKHAKNLSKTGKIISTPSAQ